MAALSLVALPIVAYLAGEAPEPGLDWRGRLVLLLFKPVFMSPLHLVRVNPHPGTVA